MSVKKGMSLVQNGIFTRPLYHGTTSLFLDSIEESGLGAKDPLAELGACETFIALFELAERELAKDEFWTKGHAGRLSPCEMLRPFAEQSYIGGNLSFKHGESYLMTNHEGATQYATKNAHENDGGGCEYLTYMKTLIGILKCKKVERAATIVDATIRKILDTQHTPILITLHGVKKSDLDTETGMPIDQQIEKIDLFFKEGFETPFSFKLRKPYYKDSFTVEMLDL